MLDLLLGLGRITLEFSELSGARNDSLGLSKYPSVVEGVGVSDLTFRALVVRVSLISAAVFSCRYKTSVL